MPGKGNPFEKNKDDNRNLFSDESDVFGNELDESRGGVGGKLSQKRQEEKSLYEEEIDLTFEEEQMVNPVRRIVLIAVSVVAGIVIGIGGYLFFTAGNRHLPREKQVAIVLPDQVAVPQQPAAPSEKPNVIPEIPVKAEPQEPETAGVKEETPQGALPKPAAIKEGLSAAGGKQTYYVQAGFFEHEANARAVADKLKQKGYAPSVKKVEGKDNKVMFRVYAGTYASHNKAVEVSETLNRQGVKALVRKQ